MYVPRKGSQLELRTGIVTCMYTHNNHRESRERRDKIFAEKTENAKIFKKKIGSGTAVFSGEFSFFGRGTTNFWGGGITSKLASQ